MAVKIQKHSLRRHISSILNKDPILLHDCTTHHLSSLPLYLPFLFFSFLLREKKNYNCFPVNKKLNDQRVQ